MPAESGRLARNPALRGIAGVFVMKSSIIVSNFLLIMAAARVLDTEHFGIYSILFSAVGLFCIVATFGQQVSVMRWWNEYTAADDPALLKGALRFSFATCLAGCAIVAAGFYFWAASNHAMMLAAAVTLFMVAQASVLTTAHLVRTAVGVGAGDGFGNLLVVLPALSYLAFCLATGTRCRCEHRVLPVFGRRDHRDAAAFRVHAASHPSPLSRLCRHRTPA